MSTGWKFPFVISAEHGRVEISELKENIRESVKIILLTEPGERVLHPEFGTKLHQFLFENIDSQTQEMIEREVRHSLQMWENRIDNIEVLADTEEERQGTLRVTVCYEILSGPAGRAENDRVEVLVS